jgi:hypothetical protein
MVLQNKQAHDFFSYWVSFFSAEIFLIAFHVACVAVLKNKTLFHFVSICYSNLGTVKELAEAKVMKQGFSPPDSEENLSLCE